MMLQEEDDILMIDHAPGLESSFRPDFDPLDAFSLLENVAMDHQGELKENSAFLASVSRLAFIRIDE